MVWFKFNDLGLPQGMVLKFYARVEKGLELRVRKFLGANSYVCRNCRGKTGRGGLFATPVIVLIL